MRFLRKTGNICYFSASIIRTNFFQLSTGETETDANLVVSDGSMDNSTTVRRLPYGNWNDGKKVPVMKTSDMPSFVRQRFLG